MSSIFVYSLWSEYIERRTTTSLVLVVLWDLSTERKKTILEDDEIQRTLSRVITLHLRCFVKVSSDLDLMAETQGGVNEKTGIFLRIEEQATFCDHSRSCLEERNEMSR